MSMWIKHASVRLYWTGCHVVAIDYNEGWSVLDVQLCYELNKCNGAEAIHSVGISHFNAINLVSAYELPRGSWICIQFLLWVRQFDACSEGLKTINITATHQEGSYLLQYHHLLPTTDLQCLVVGQPRDNDCNKQTSASKIHFVFFSSLITVSFVIESVWLHAGKQMVPLSIGRNTSVPVLNPLVVPIKSVEPSIFACQKRWTELPCLLKALSRVVMPEKGVESSIQLGCFTRSDTVI